MWLQTGEYQLEGLYWLIALAVVFIIAVVALIVAARTASRLREMVDRLASVAAAHARLSGALTEAEPRMKHVEAEYEPRTPEALRLLDGRYANGEITRDEYLQLEADLMSTARRVHEGSAPPPVWWDTEVRTPVQPPREPR